MSKKGLAAAVATTAVGGAVAKRLIDQREQHREPELDLENGPDPRPDRSRQELYELARRLDIPGRSKMNKRQLQEAVSAREGRR